MHSCTSVCGYSASMASGNPFSPSTQAMKISFTPRFFSSVSTCSQNLAPSCCATHSPRTSFLPLAIHSQHHIDRLVLHVPAVANLYHHGVQLDDGIHLLH